WRMRATAQSVGDGRGWCHQQDPWEDPREDPSADPLGWACPPVTRSPGGGPEHGVATAIGAAVRGTHDLARVVDALGPAAVPAGQGAQVPHHAVLPDKGVHMATAVGGVRLAHNLARGINTSGAAVVVAGQGAQVLYHAVL